MKTFSKFLTTLVVCLGLAMTSAVMAATAPSLGVADSFAVLGWSAINVTVPSTIVGDVGLSPAGWGASALTCAEVVGAIYSVDASGPLPCRVTNPVLVGNAQTALTAAYGVAAAEADVTIGSALAGIITPGSYNSAAGTFTIPGALTLDAWGNPDAVFIFDMTTTLTTAAASTITLAGGAQACNVFWRVGSSATLGTTSTFVGTIMADQSITDNGGSTVAGRFLASIAAVTLNNTTITKPTCAAAAGGGNRNRPAPLINITKIPSPLALPSGPWNVTYYYVVTNVGVVPMNNIWVDDDKCSAVTFLNGDTNLNTELDVNEIWSYSCTAMVTGTITNIVTAHGNYHGDVYDTAEATVVVGVPLVPPLIHLVKKPNKFLLPSTGGAVTYHYTVTNPGTEPLHDVSITDDKCTGLPGRVVGHPGDLNKNDILESNEIRQFTCQTYLTGTTTNIGTVEGHANGFTIFDSSPATVVVASEAFTAAPIVTPKLPKTGLLPQKTITILTLISIAMMVSFGLVVVLRKRAI